MALMVAKLVAEIVCYCGECNNVLDMEDLDGDLTDLECTLDNHEEVLTGIHEVTCWNCNMVNRIPTLLEVVQSEEADGDSLQTVG